MYLEDKRLNPQTDQFAKQRARRTYLIELLRDPSRWPSGFVWAYNDCRACAMGLLLRVTGRTDIVDIYVLTDWYAERYAIAVAIGLSQDDSFAILMTANCIVGTDDVLPEHVAALLEVAPYA